MSAHRAAALAGVVAVLAAAAVVTAVVRDGPDRAEPPARAPAVVSVVVSQRIAGPPERATGFLTSAGHVVTVAHVLDAGGRIAVRGRAARVLRIDRAADLALLRVRTGLSSTGAGAAAARPSLVRIREGRAESVPVVVRRRITARVKDSVGPRFYSRPALELGVSVAAGDSGAPVVDGRGRLLGVVFATSTSREGTAYAVEAGAVRALLRP